MDISPTLRPLLRDILGAEEAVIDDATILKVSKMLAEVKYLDSVLGDAYDLSVRQFSRYQLN